ncbi:MAG: hypothetical protein D6705_07955 [Deltaproteobacteria bacterium]|nr:MAG: hypothetical protein D6705_07955 [Deltaproteobacteria bacterium]
MRRVRPRHCPGCGAPAHADGHTGAVPCEFCGTPLVPLGVPDPRSSLRCPGCATLVAGGASFCPACGVAMATATADDASPLDCPACGEGVEMASFAVAPNRRRPEGLSLHGCRRCGGCFAPKPTMDALVEEAAAAAVPGAIDPRSVPRFELRTSGGPVTYRRCPSCRELMARRNFGRISGVVVDACDRCGTFFDARELEDVLAFVRAGGLLLAARREAEDLRASAPARPASGPWEPAAVGTFPEGTFALAGFEAASALVRFLGRWIADRFGHRSDDS